MNTSRGSRRQERVGGGTTNLERQASARIADNTSTATTILPTSRTINTAPRLGKPTGFKSSRGTITPLDKDAPLSSRTKAGIIASLYSEKGQVLAPFWPRVTTTPYNPRHRVLNGYGREMQACAVSYDAPEFFHIPETMIHVPSRFRGLFTEKRKRHSPLAVGSTAESPDLPHYLQVPGIDEFWGKYNRKKGDPKHLVLLYKREAICEPNLPPDPTVISTPPIIARKPSMGSRNWRLEER